jgi:hypothetical protein
MKNLYLCTGDVRDREESHPILKKFGRKVFRCEIWAKDQNQALTTSKQIREQEFPSRRYDYLSEMTVEHQEGPTIEGNREAYKSIGKIYEVLPNGRAVVRDEDKEAYENC